MLVIPELTENYLPQPDDLLVELNDSYDIISQLLDNFPYYFENPVNSPQEQALMPAIQSAYTISKHIGGRMLIFQVTQAIQRMPELQPKKEAETNAGDKFAPSNMVFQNEASNLAHAQISVDLFVFTVGKGIYKNL